MKAALAIVLVAGGVAAAQPAGSGSGAGSAATLQIPLDASAPEVSAAASPTELKLGTRFTVFVTATFGPGVTVNLREPLELGGAFEVGRKLSADTVQPDGRRQREWQLEVYAWDLGDLEIPPIAVTFTASGRAGQVQTNAIPVRVVGVLGDADDPKLMRGDAPPVALRQHTWLWNVLHDPRWLAIAAAALVVGIFVARWPRKRKVTQVVGSLAPRAPRKLDMTSARALERLREIERSGALDGDRDAACKLAYADMADVVREYVGARYAIPTARELTSGELVARLERTASERDRGLVAGWLDRCDPVRYGGERATGAAGRQVLADARTLIATTSGRAAA